MNFEINVYFAKFLMCPRYITYISHILNTEMKPYNMNVDVRFYANKEHFWDRNDLTPTEALDAIKLLVARMSVKLTPELKMDYIEDYLFQGKC